MRSYGFLLVFLAFFVGSHDSVSILNNDSNSVNDIDEWVEENSSRVRNFTRNLDIPTSWRHFRRRSFSEDSVESFYCTMCKSVTKSIIRLRRSGFSIEFIKKTFGNLCTFLNIQSEEVCHSMFDLNLPVVLYIIDKDLTVTHKDICGLALQDKKNCRPTERYQWKIEVDDADRKFTNPKFTEERIKIIQLSDIHYDPMYEPNGNTNCREPTCCRKGQNHTSGSEILAGYWGDFNYCDSPWHAVVDALDSVKNEHEKIDYIYFTGDIIDHGIWETTHEKNRESLVKIFSRIRENFGRIPVYPILGNHEPNPANLFASDGIEEEEFSTKWLYSLLADIWIGSGWLPESTRKTILRGGYYTLVPIEGFRIIAMNNNVAYVFNWWVIYRPKDPNGQLQWLQNVLLEAEEKGEKVHILNHIPGGSVDCQETWNREYQKIINRFSHIITAQFNGHTHHDELNLIYDTEDFTKVRNIAWNGGSITPYANLNPNYKVYSVNADSYVVEDVDIWIYNLTEANLNPEKNPNWFKLYSFKEKYNLKNLSRESLNDWIINMAKNTTIQHQFHRNFFKHAAPELDKICDTECLEEYICRIVTSQSNDNTVCKYFKTLS